MNFTMAILRSAWDCSVVHVGYGQRLAIVDPQLIVQQSTRIQPVAHQLVQVGLIVPIVELRGEPSRVDDHIEVFSQLLQELFGTLNGLPEMVRFDIRNATPVLVDGKPVVIEG